MRNGMAIGVMTAAAVMAAMASVGCTGNEVVAKASAATRNSQVERGEYLVKIMGCNDCHTPMKMGPNGPESDMTRFLSGHPEQIGKMPPAPKPQGLWIASSAATNTAFAGPWGVSYTANLTPDRNTGLGIWTEEMFVTALRTGKHMGTSREILPPMPWPAFRNATDDDLKSVFAYLRSIKPVVNHVPDIDPPAAVATH